LKVCGTSTNQIHTGTTSDAKFLAQQKSKCFVKPNILQHTAFYLFIDILLKLQQPIMICFHIFSWNSEMMGSCEFRPLFCPLLHDWILSRLRVVRQETWSYSTWSGKCSIQMCIQKLWRQYCEVPLDVCSTTMQNLLSDLRTLFTLYISLVLLDWFSSMSFYLWFCLVFQQNKHFHLIALTADICFIFRISVANPGN